MVLGVAGDRLGTDGDRPARSRLRGRGAGTSALAQWTTLLFEATAWRRLDFATWSGNTAMCRVGERLAFVREATFRRARVVEGEVYDSVVYGVLREDWAVWAG
ncbi:GNAT family N-acetyltransferase [Sanguibacter gelidistatuariae]|uniref:GNAT family N-acetyltransferase n=1 Tax=Sanguibacter gelidistatuariae TaxID=1814289 RepID=UPI000B838337|nr:GNAT family protein [Sanguibacter gelidistatuariae]